MSTGNASKALTLNRAAKKQIGMNLREATLGWTGHEHSVE